MRKVESRRLKSGSVTYFIRVRDPRRGKQTSVPFSTRPEATQFAKLVDALGVADALAYLEEDDPGQPTLDEWAARHFASLTGITPGTRITYERIYARSWQPALGHLRLGKVTRERVAQALNALTGSDKTIRNAHGVLASMMKTAHRDGLIDRNPCEGMRLPRRTEHETTEHRYLTQVELKQLLDAMPAYWRPLVWMLAGTGMRWSEADALQVGDVDLAAAVVHVTKSVKWDVSKATGQVGPPKTRRSRRTITLPPEVVEAVTPLTVGRRKTERLFLPPQKGPLRHRTFWSDVWRKAITKANLDPPPRIHDLRHSHVAWLIDAGVPLPVIQARLGHESITTTINVYGHLLPDLQRAAADAASVVLGGARPAIEA